MQFPSAALPQGTTGAEVRAAKAGSRHAVQLYEVESFLFESVARFVREGRKLSEPTVVVSTPAHRAGIVAALGAAVVEEATTSGWLLFVDAQSLLSRLLRDGVFDADAFERETVELRATLRERTGASRVRLFGEMVDLLCQAHDVEGARALEALCHRLSARDEWSVLCGYHMRHFEHGSANADLCELCAMHGQVLPREAREDVGDLDHESALRQVSELAQRTRVLESELERSRALERQLRDALKDRQRLDRELSRSLWREHQARRLLDANEAFQEAFVGTLGHDLREPLNTILTTARLMTMRRELTADGQRRLDRVIASGVRMQRMIEQMLDLIQDQMASNSLVTRSGERDLGEIVLHLVEEARAAHPGRSFELTVEPCTAVVDAERIEQAISTLLGNAVTHGDPERPIEIGLEARDDQARLFVHNYGPAIDPSLLGTLFEPFRRVSPSSQRRDGLGLGLYIASRIVRAHGGMLQVASSEAFGTRFEAALPRRA